MTISNANTHKLQLLLEQNMCIKVVCMTPPCPPPTASFPVFLLPVFTTHSSSSSIYTIYESSDPQGEILHSIDYFHLVLPHDRLS